MHQCLPTPSAPYIDFWSLRKSRYWTSQTFAFCWLLQMWNMLLCVSFRHTIGKYYMRARRALRLKAIRWERTKYHKSVCVPHKSYLKNTVASAKQQKPKAWVHNNSNKECAWYANACRNNYPLMDILSTNQTRFRYNSTLDWLFQTCGHESSSCQNLDLTTTLFARMHAPHRLRIGPG